MGLCFLSAGIKTTVLPHLAGFYNYKNRIAGTSQSFLCNSILYVLNICVCEVKGKSYNNRNMKQFFKEEEVRKQNRFAKMIFYCVLPVYWSSEIK